LVPRSSTRMRVSQYLTREFLAVCSLFFACGAKRVWSNILVVIVQYKPSKIRRHQDCGDRTQEYGTFMQWIAPSQKDDQTDTLEKRLWQAADQLRANSGLSSAQYSTPVLGLIFLRFAEARFAKQREKLQKTGSSGRRATPRIDDPAAYHAEGVVYLTPSARYDHLLNLAEGSNVGQIVNAAMADIEKHNPQLAGVLPRTYQIFNSTLLKELLKKVSEIPASLEYDAFGRIYEYFLGEFARTEGQKGGEFFTPTAIVRLIVEVIEPFHGRLLDPASGSGGMFVQSARFVQAHKKNPSSELAIYGQEKVGATVALSRM
jgi:type I restriction enzyme M protein